MTPNVRRAAILDTKAMAALLNNIIEAGGTTALTSPVTGQELADWMAKGGDRAVWHVAEDAGGRVLGFQWIGPDNSLPPEACDIATFVEVGHAGLGIGSALFEATKTAARQLGYSWINANIRADNSGGLIYYQSRGFEDYGIKANITLDDGQTVDKVLKRFTL